MHNMTVSSFLARIVLGVLVVLGSVRVTARRTRIPETLDQWLAQLKDPDAAKRRQAVVALGSFGPDLTKAMIQQVGELLKDPDQMVRHAARAVDRKFWPGIKGGPAEYPGRRSRIVASGTPRGGLCALETWAPPPDLRYLN